MKTSSRNAYPGKITAIIPGNLSDEVEISLESGEKIYSQVSHACTESLSLALFRYSRNTSKHFTSSGDSPKSSYLKRA